MARSVNPKRKNAKGFFILLLLIGIGTGGYYLWKQRAALAAGKPVELKRFEKEQPLMGTIAGLTVYAESQEKADSAFKAAFARGDEINRVASDYLADSELTLFNETPAETWSAASEDLLTMVAYGLELADLTSGAFDPTLGTMTHLWRETKRAGALPSAATLDGVRADAGWELVEADLKNGRLRRLRAGVRLDLGGIGKGYAADEMLKAVERLGIRSALVVVGGDVRCGQAPPGEEGWVVGLNDIDNQLEATITVSDCGVSTSGDLQQFVDIDGRRYSHIVDPDTGLGLNDSLLCTVVARNSMMADTLATTGCVNPTFFKDLKASTGIHSRILSAEQSQISRGFPRRTPILEEVEPTGQDSLEGSVSQSMGE